MWLSDVLVLISNVHIHLWFASKIYPYKTKNALRNRCKEIEVLFNNNTWPYNMVTFYESLSLRDFIQNY
jgi:hypothetical protein